MSTRRTTFIPVMILTILLAIIGGTTSLMKTSSSNVSPHQNARTAELKFITLDPGHFHAALVLKEMYPGVSKQVHVYAPLGADLTDHLNRVARFNNRAENPTAWELEIKTGPDFMRRMLEERPGNVVVLSGRNQGKIDLINASLGAGLNVLADKPWILNP